VSAEVDKKPPDRSRRAVILATVGIVVILGLAVLYVAVVAPLRRVHRVICSSTKGEISYEDAIARLGGPERAPNRLSAYLRLPQWMGTNRAGAIWWLSRIGSRARAAVPTLIKLLTDPDIEIRRHATLALGEIGPGAEDAVPTLIQALGNSDSGLRWCAAIALGHIGPEAKAAVPALLRLSKNENEDASLRGAADESLDMIRTSEP